MWYRDYVPPMDAPLGMIPDDPDIDETAQVEPLGSEVRHCQRCFERDGVLEAQVEVGTRDWISVHLGDRFSDPPTSGLFKADRGLKVSA